MVLLGVFLGAPGDPNKRRRVMAGQKVHVLNPPTLWSGVLDNLEARGGFLPPTPLRSGRLARALPNINTFDPNGPSLDPFG